MRRRATLPQRLAPLLVGLLAALAIVPSAASAEPPLLRSFCPTGSAGGQCIIPRGIAVDPTSGEIYVADQQNRRVEKFTAWGEFVRAWGWDVVASGPGDDTIAPEDQFEVCVPAQGDVCKAGLAGVGPGQIQAPQGIALDSAGDVYVTDPGNLVKVGGGGRVQKFAPEGEFLLMFGGDVNRTKVEAAAPEAERNRCPVDLADQCQAGTEGTGNGQFGFWPLGSYIAIDRKGTETAADDIVYVGDEGRVQEFDQGGNYVADLPDPDGVLAAGGTVNSLALDQVSGELYLGFWTGKVVAPHGKPNVQKVNGAGEEECTIEAHSPTAIAVGAAGEVYVVEGDRPFPFSPREISRYGSGCGGREVLFGPGEGGFTVDPSGIAASSACGIQGTDLIISNHHDNNSFVKIFGPPPTDFEPPCHPPPSVAPSIVDQLASSVGAGAATVRAKINPHFWTDTAYFVQYATAACVEAGGWEAACVEQEPASPLLLSAEVLDAELATTGIALGLDQPLAPAGEYRFRFVAQSTGGGPAFGPEVTFRTYPLPAPAKADCPNQAHRTGTSAFLPDCRAYELVSPVDKNGGEVLTPRVESLNQAAAEGDALSFTSTTGFAQPQGAPASNQYLSERGTEGWLTRSINAPRTTPSLVFGENTNPRFKAFSEDLCSGWLLQDTDLPLLGGGVPRGVVNLYRDRALRPGCAGPGGYQLLTTIFPPGFDPSVEKNDSHYYPQLQGFSADGEVSVYRAPAALNADACATPNQGKGIYQLYLSREGQPGVAPRLISVLPSGAAACAGSSVGTAQGFAFSPSTRQDSLHNAVSANGSRVYWSVGTGRIYLRLNATEPQSALNQAGRCTEPAKACTLAVSAEAEALSGTSASRYLDAAADGSLAFFSSGEDLYEFDLDKALARDPAVTLIAPKAKGVLGASEDGSALYFVSTKSLGGEGEEGVPNLYLYQRGAGATFVATLGGKDDASFGGSNAPSSSVGAHPYKRTSRVSPDGLHTAFTSADPALASSVAEYDNRDAQSGVPTREVYLYDAAADGGAGKLVCASCNPSGARPAGRVTEQVNANPDSWVWSAARLPGWPTAMHPGGALSANGQRLFFESFEPLVLRDTNGVGDVYQWQAAASEAGCLQAIGGELYLAASGGCLSLISSGTGSTDAELIDASTDGADVFIRTDAGLLAQDPALADAYDARIGGGLPQPTTLAACEGEACQSPPAPPQDPTPASSTFQGAGNVKAPSRRCKKGKRRVRRKGTTRCLPKKKKRSARQGRAAANQRAAR